jgi:hypothetical protein
VWKKNEERNQRKLAEKTGRGGCTPRLGTAKGATGIDRITLAIEKGSGIDAGSGPSAVR